MKTNLVILDKETIGVLKATNRVEYKKIDEIKEVVEKNKGYILYTENTAIMEETNERVVEAMNCIREVTILKRENQLDAFDGIIESCFLGIRLNKKADIITMAIFENREDWYNIKPLGIEQIVSATYKELAETVEGYAVDRVAVYDENNIYFLEDKEHQFQGRNGTGYVAITNLIEDLKEGKKIDKSLYTATELEDRNYIKVAKHYLSNDCFDYKEGKRMLEITVLENRFLIHLMDTLDGELATSKGIFFEKVENVQEVKKMLELLNESFATIDECKVTASYSKKFFQLHFNNGKMTDEQKEMILKVVGEVHELLTSPEAIKKELKETLELIFEKESIIIYHELLEILRKYYPKFHKYMVKENATTHENYLKGSLEMYNYIYNDLYTTLDETKAEAGTIEERFLGKLLKENHKR